MHMKFMKYTDKRHLARHLTEHFIFHGNARAWQLNIYIFPPYVIEH